MNIVSCKPLVWKRRLPFGCAHCQPELEKPWSARNALGTECFDTWREAYDYATIPIVMMN